MTITPLIGLAADRKVVERIIDACRGVQLITVAGDLRANTRNRHLRHRGLATRANGGSVHPMTGGGRAHTFVGDDRP